MAGYLVWRRRQGLDPRRRYRIHSQQRPLDFLEVSYKSALVPIFGPDIDGDAMRRAAAVVDPGATIEALYVVQVPVQSDLPDGLEQEEYEARCALDVARLQARARGLRVRVKMIRARNPGAAIVKEARERRSDLIYLSTEHAPSDERLLGPTTRYILAKRPCRVIVEGGNAANGDSGVSLDGRSARRARRAFAQRSVRRKPPETRGSDPTMRSGAPAGWAEGSSCSGSESEMRTRRGRLGALPWRSRVLFAAITP